MLTKLITIAVFFKLSSQTIVWDSLEDICYYNQSEVNNVNYIKTRCELVPGVQVQKRFFRDFYYWCIAINDGKEVIIEDYSNDKENVILPVVPKFLSNRSKDELNLKLDNYTGTYLKGNHKVRVEFSPDNKLLSLIIDDEESCDQTRLDDTDPIYPNQKNKNPLKYFEKCVELNSIRQSPENEFCEDLEVANYHEFVLNGQDIFHCLTINKSIAPEQYGNDIIELVLYISGKYTLRWSNNSNTLVKHGNTEFFFHVMDSIIVSVEPKSNEFQHVMQNIFINNVTNCMPIAASRVCGVAWKTHQPFSIFDLPTHPGQYPWQVALFKHIEAEPIHICDGTLINVNVILTAAHCLYENKILLPTDRVSVKLGIFDMRVSSAYTLDLTDITAFVIHDQFNIDTLQHDIGLLLTRNNIKTNEYVDKLCFESMNDKLFTQPHGFVPSWPMAGQNHYKYILAEAKVIFSNTCDSITNQTTELCGRYDFNGTTACARDGGGLVVRFADGYFLRGIVTKRQSNDDNCRTDEEVIFIDTLKYIKWIKSTINLPIIKSCIKCS